MKMKKQFLSILLSLGMMLGLMLVMSLTAYADVEKYPLWVGGKQVTSGNASNIDGNNKASYNAGTRTLTLNGFSYTGNKSGINYTGSETLNLVLTGANSIKNTEKDGVSVDYANLNISGTGSLTVNSTGGNCDAIAVYRDNNNLTINNATLTLNGVFLVSILTII